MNGAPCPGLAWADVGCGTGVVTSTILTMCGSSSVSGIDSSEGFAQLQLPADGALRCSMPPRQLRVRHASLAGIKWAGREPELLEIAQQFCELPRNERLGGGGNLRDGPPSKAPVAIQFSGLHPGRCRLKCIRWHQEEVFAFREQAPIREVAAVPDPELAIHDRSSAPSFLTDLSGGRLSRFLVWSDSAAGSDPEVSRRPRDLHEENQPGRGQKDPASALLHAHLHTREDRNIAASALPNNALHPTARAEARSVEFRSELSEGADGRLRRSQLAGDPLGGNRGSERRGDQSASLTSLA